MKRLIILLLVILAAGNINALPQFRIFKSNRVDSKGERHGTWKSYWNDKDRNVYRKGKYRHGLEKGKWKYYDEKGNLIKTEKYISGRKIIITKNFYKNGKIESEGEAHLLNEDDGALHYFWQGTWKFYDEKGELIKTEEYVKGKRVFTGKPPFHNE